MREIVYADLIFLLNFCMDFLALFAAGRVLALPLSPLRLSAASAAGALYCIATFLYDGSVIPAALVHVAVSALLCLIAFDIKSPAAFAKVFVLFYFACFLLGGGIEALYRLAGFVNAEQTDVGLGMGARFPIHITLILAAVICVPFIVFGRLARRSIPSGNTQVKITLGPKTVTLRALVDSGSNAFDPITGLPVVVARLAAVAPLLDAGTAELFSGGFPDTEALDKFIGRPALPVRFRVIPISTVAGSRLLPAFVPTGFYIHGRKGKAFTRSAAVIAVDGGGEYAGAADCLLPAAML